MDATKAGQGEVEVEIEGSKRRVASRISKTPTAGLYEVAFIPRDAGPHEIAVKFHSRTVPGSFKQSKE